MATNSNPNRTALAGRVAAQKRQAAETKQLQLRVAASWTLAKTLIPTAPPEIQVRVAKSLLQNGTRELKAMLRQAAVNAHFTRLAEEFKNVHKMDLNDLMDPPSSLTKEQNEVLRELKGEAKNAGKKATGETGEQPATYDEGKRKEPAEMDAEGAGDRPKIDKEMKEGSAKKSCDCDGGDKKASPVKGKKADELAHRDDSAPIEPAQTPLAKGTKDAAVKAKKAEMEEEDEGEQKEASSKKSVKAAPAKAAPVKGTVKAAEESKGEGEAKPESDKQAAKVVAKTKKAEDEEKPAESSEPPAEEGSDESSEEVPGEDEGLFDEEAGIEDAAEDEVEDSEEEEDVFDEEKVTLEDAIEDVKQDVEVLTEAIESEIGDADEINLDEMGLAEGEEDAAATAMDEMHEDPFAQDDPEAPPMDDYPGEELNMDDVLSEDNFADKVSALANEDDVNIAFDEMFSNEPSDAEELERLLDPETEEVAMSPVDIFAVTGEESDPMAMLFASHKLAADETAILKPGTLDKHFETELAGDDRDWESDHDGDIFADVFKSLKQMETGQTRVQQDREPALKEPAEAKQATKKGAPVTKSGTGKPLQKQAPTTIAAKGAAPKGAAAKGAAPKTFPAKTPAQQKKGSSFPKLAPHFDPLKDAVRITGGNLASALFPDEADYL